MALVSIPLATGGVARCFIEGLLIERLVWVFWLEEGFLRFGCDTEMSRRKHF
jgi:hypothetical protein